MHCIGIGGIAISGIAKLLQARGVHVSGSDGTASDITRSCESLGMAVAIGHRAQNVSPAVEVVVYSEAVPDDNAERTEARRRGVVELTGADALASLAEGKRLIAVAGTNGKSTTTAMIGLILERAGLDPTVVVGSIVPGWQLGSVRDGNGEWMVIEADEYARKLLNYRPEIAVVTNIEEDHMDVYRDLDDIVRTFQQFIEGTTSSGLIIANGDDRNVQRLRVPAGRKLATFGVGSGVRYRLVSRETHAREQTMELVGEGRLTLRVPGEFNFFNAAAAAACAREIGIGFDVVQKTLATFSGIWRRFEMLGEWRGATVVSDYAHHPTAVRGTLAAAREWTPGSRVVAVFQPHHHNRTRALFDEFAQSFADADVIVLCDVYDVVGREAGDRVDIAELVTAVTAEFPGKDVRNGGAFADLRARLEPLVRPGDLILFLGAGDIDTFARSLLS